MCRVVLSQGKNQPHKGDHGHVVVLGGDKGFGGAGIMAAEAAQRRSRTCHLGYAERTQNCRIGTMPRINGDWEEDEKIGVGF